MRTWWAVSRECSVEANLWGAILVALASILRNTQQEHVKRDAYSTFKMCQTTSLSGLRQEANRSRTFRKQFGFDYPRISNDKCLVYIEVDDALSNAPGRSPLSSLPKRVVSAFL